MLKAKYNPCTASTMNWHQARAREVAPCYGGQEIDKVKDEQERREYKDKFKKFGPKSRRTVVIKDVARILISGFLLVFWIEGAMSYTEIEQNSLNVSRTVTAHNSSDVITDEKGDIEPSTNLKGILNDEKIRVKPPHLISESNESSGRYYDRSDKTQRTHSDNFGTIISTEKAHTAKNTESGKIAAGTVAPLGQSTTSSLLPYHLLESKVNAKQHHTIKTVRHPRNFGNNANNSSSTAKAGVEKDAGDKKPVQMENKCAGGGCGFGNAKDIRNNNHSESDNSSDGVTINGPGNKQGSANNGHPNKSVDTAGGKRRGSGAANNNYVDNGKSSSAPQEQLQNYFATPMTETTRPPTWRPLLSATAPVNNPTAPAGIDKDDSLGQAPEKEESFSIGGSDAGQITPVADKSHTKSASTGVIQENDNNNGAESDLGWSSRESNPSLSPLPRTITIATHLGTAEDGGEIDMTRREENLGKRGHKLKAEAARKVEEDPDAITSTKASDRQMDNIRLHAPTTSSSPVLAAKNGLREEKPSSESLTNKLRTIGGGWVDKLSQTVNNSSFRTGAPATEDKSTVDRTPPTVVVVDRESIQHAYNSVSDHRANTDRAPNKRSGAVNEMNNTSGLATTTVRGNRGEGEVGIDVVTQIEDSGRQMKSSGVLIVNGLKNQNEPVRDDTSIISVENSIGTNPDATYSHKDYPTLKQSLAEGTTHPLETTQTPLGLTETEKPELPPTGTATNNPPGIEEKAQPQPAVEESSAINASEIHKLHLQTNTGTTTSGRISGVTSSVRATPIEQQIQPTDSRDVVISVDNGGSDEHIKSKNFAKTPSVAPQPDETTISNRNDVFPHNILVPELVPTGDNAAEWLHSLPQNKKVYRSDSVLVLEGGDRDNTKKALNGSDASARAVVNEDWPVKQAAVVEGDVVIGGLMMVHEREDSVTCGPIMPQGGVQALEAMLFTLDKINSLRLLPNISLGAHILDDCDKDTYGLEMAVDFIKG